MDSWKGNYHAISSLFLKTVCKNSFAGKVLVHFNVANNRQQLAGLPPSHPTDCRSPGPYCRQSNKRQAASLHVVPQGAQLTHCLFLCKTGVTGQASGPLSEEGSPRARTIQHSSQLTLRSPRAAFAHRWGRGPDYCWGESPAARFHSLTPMEAVRGERCCSVLPNAAEVGNNCL